MLYIYPVGGLGNMFFHIASIWTLANDNDDELCLLNIDQKINSLINDKRECDLTHAPTYKYFLNRFPQSNKIIDNKIEYPFNYVPLEYKKEHQYIGYFQHEQYFKHRRNEIIELFKPINEFNDKINEYSYFFGNISLHIRRHMYVDMNITLPIKYYEDAISKLPQDLNILIFSDDLPWCKENFIGNRFIFVDEIDYISLYIMAKMKYHIIANSTFSWWGAWLSEYNDKVTIKS
jgi:hypothetical protein